MKRILTITSVFPLDERGAKGKPARFKNTSHTLAEAFAKTMYKDGYIIEEEKFEVYDSFTDAIEDLAR